MAHTSGTTTGAISASVPWHGIPMYVVSGGGSGGATFALRSQGSNRCLGITGASQANGTAVAIWDCNGGTNQKWTRV